MIVKLPKEIAAFIRLNGDAYVSDDKTYYHLPYWYAPANTIDKDFFDEYYYDDLPEEIKQLYRIEKEAAKHPDE